MLATEDSTVLTIITSDGDTTPLAYTLMAGQAQQFSTPSTDDGFGFSGLRVKSNGKPFAMFQGNRCTYVPSTHGACDHLYEQCLPVARWGRQFVLVPTAGRTLSGERVRVTSLNDNCTVQYDGTTTTLQGGGTVEYNLPPGAAKTLTASDKVTVCIYLSGGSYGGEPGDPAMVLVPPMEQGVRSATFKAINTDITTHHYANIVVATRYVPYMRIDTLRIDTAFHSIGNGYSYAQLSVEPGTHTLHADTGRFTAHFYGLGNFESYAYVAGMGLRQTDNRMLVNGVDDLVSGSGIAVCQGDSVDLDFLSADTTLTAGWFVDGTFITNNKRHLRHVFDSAGRFEVMAVVYSLCDTLLSYVTVHPSSQELTMDTVCDGVAYEWRGQLITGEGLFTDSLQTMHGCDSLTSLQLKRTGHAHPAIVVDNDCRSMAYRLTASLEDTSLEGAVRWLSQPHDPVTDSSAGRGEIEVRPSRPTRYSMTLNIDCSDTASVVLDQIRLPRAGIKVSPEVLDYSHTTCTAVDISSFGTSRKWLVDGLESGSDRVLHTFADPRNDSMTITLVEFEGYCADTAVKVVPILHQTMWAPNIFIPGHDGNDRFRVSNAEIEPQWLYIYNRQGLLIYSTDSPDAGWDGTHNGTPVPQGAYVWKLVYRTAHRPEETHSAIGTVTLLR